MHGARVSSYPCLSFHMSSPCMFPPALRKVRMIMSLISSNVTIQPSHELHLQGRIHSLCAFAATSHETSPHMVLVAQRYGTAADSQP